MPGRPHSTCYSHAIMAEARARYLQQLRRERGDEDSQGGAVPGLYDPSSKKMYGAYTTGFKQGANQRIRGRGLKLPTRRTTTGGRVVCSLAALGSPATRLAPASPGT